MPAGELASVQRDRDDLALADAHLDAATDKVRVERVVVGIEPDVRIGRRAGHEATIKIKLARGQRAHR